MSGEDGDGFSTAAQESPAPRPLLAAIWRGFRMRCPACGLGALFQRYLKVGEHCQACGEALHHQRADDAPPYVTIVVVGHIVIPLVLLVERQWAPPTIVHWLAWLPLTLALSLLLLPRIKGAVVGMQWACRMHGFAGPDPNDPPI